MVTDDGALVAVSAGPDGILAGLRPGALYIDMSTVSPSASRELAERVRSRGAVMIDAPVSGGVAAAETGTLSIMVGGTEAGYRAAEPLLLRLGRTVTHVGGNGHGLLLDLAINISFAAQKLAFNEGVLLAERGGIDPALAARAIGSPMPSERWPLVLDLPGRARLPDQEPCDMALMHKDIRLALKAASESGVALPVAVAVESALSQARDIAFGPQRRRPAVQGPGDGMSERRGAAASGRRNDDRGTREERRGKTPHPGAPERTGNTA